MSRIFLILVLLTLPFSAFADLSSKGWSRYTSDNFVLYANDSEEKVQATLRDFEMFRAILHSSLGIQSSEQVPVSIYLFSNDVEYSPFKINKAAGYFRNSLFGPTIVVGSHTSKAENMETLFHEYVHYILRSSSFNYPSWYDEGLSQYFSTIQIRGDYANIGREGKYTTLNRDDLRKLTNLFTDRNPIGTGASFKKVRSYYSSSWLLVHFLSLSSINGFDDYSEELFNYLTKLNEGVEHSIAFEQSFTMTDVEFARKVKSYLRLRKRKITQVPLPDIEVNIKKVAIDEGAMSSLFASLAFEVGSLKGRQKFAQRAQELNDSTAIAYQALQLAREKKEEAALSLAQKAVQGNNVNAMTYFHVARTYSRLGATFPEKAEQMANVAKYYYEQANKIKVLPQTLFFSSDVYWGMGNKKAAIDSLLALIKMMPAHVGANFKFGRYLLLIEEYESAQHFLRNVINWTKSKKLKEEAQALLAEAEAKSNENN